MAATGMGVGFLELLILLGVVGGAPLSIPPREYDPLMFNAPPEQCVFYFSQAGIAEADGGAEAQGERLLAAPEMQRFGGELMGVVRRLLDKAAETSPDREQFELLTEIAGDALKSPMCLYVERFSPPIPGGGEFDLRLAFMCKLGDKAAEYEAKALAMVKDQGIETESFTIRGATFQRFRIDDAAPRMYIGRLGKTFIFTVGDGTLEGLVRRALRKKAPSWLTAMRETAQIGRPATMFYVNLVPIWEMAEESIPPFIFDVKKALATTGLNELQSIERMTGFAGPTHRSVTRLRLDKGEGSGEQESIWDLLVGKPITEDDLKQVDAAAMGVYVTRFDVTRLIEGVEKIARGLSPRTGQQLDMGYAQAKQLLGFDLKADLLASLGDRITTVVYGPQDFLMSISLKDSAKFNQVMQRLIALAQQQMSRRGGPGGQSPLRTETVSGTTVYSVVVPGPIPLSPCWGVQDNRLLYAMSLDRLKKSLLGTTISRPLSSRPEIAALLKQPNPPFILSYTDMRATLKEAYPKIEPALAVVKSALDIDIEFPKLPPWSAIEPTLLPKVMQGRRDKEGIVFQGDQTLPGLDAVAAVPSVLPLLVPAVQQARGAARRVESQNDMKQLMLAMLNYETDHTAFPTAYSKAKNGKPGLSWRVYLLPYLEEQALFKSFHLDEPWDSPHNKKLIEKMPDVFRPNASKAPKGHTVYLAIRHQDGVIATPDKGAVRFRDIQDGSSNTIVMMRVPDANAVPWTKPDDFEVGANGDLPFAQWAQSGMKQLLVAFCDSSVQSIPITISAKTFRALCTKSGGEVIRLPRQGAEAPARPVPFGAP